MKVDRNPTQRCVGKIGKGGEKQVDSFFGYLLWFVRYRVHSSQISPTENLSPDKKRPTLKWWNGDGKLPLVQTSQESGVAWQPYWCLLLHRSVTSSQQYNAVSPAADPRPLQLYRKAPLSSPNQWKLSALTKAVTQFRGRTPSTNPQPPIFLPILPLRWMGTGSTLEFGKERSPECWTALEPLSIVVVGTIRRPFQ